MREIFVENRVREGVMGEDRERLRKTEERERAILRVGDGNEIELQMEGEREEGD